MKPGKHVELFPAFCNVENGPGLPLVDPHIPLRVVEKVLKSPNVYLTILLLQSEKIILTSTVMAYYDIEDYPDVMSDISRNRQILKYFSDALPVRAYQFISYVNSKNELNIFPVIFEIKQCWSVFSFQPMISTKYIH